MQHACHKLVQRHDLTTDMNLLDSLTFRTNENRQYADDLCSNAAFGISFA
jgi:hypothetical protein